MKYLPNSLQYVSSVTYNTLDSYSYNTHVITSLHVKDNAHEVKKPPNGGLYYNNIIAAIA